MSYLIAYLLLTLCCICFSDKYSIWYRYSFRVWLAIDQLANTVLGGSEDHTISGRAGRGRAAGSRFWAVIAGCIDFIFRDKQHCSNAIEHDEREIDYGYSLSMLFIYGCSAAMSVGVFGLLIDAALQ